MFKGIMKYFLVALMSLPPSSGKVLYKLPYSYVLSAGLFHKPALIYPVSCAALRSASFFA